MERRRFLAGAAALAAAAARARIAWAADPEWRPSGALLRNLPRLLELASVPGVAIAVVEEGETSTHSVGRAARGGPAVSGDTVFEAASLGKPLVAYAALRLADRRALDLDRPLCAYVQTPDADNPTMRAVTARHVLTHTTGLPNWRKAAGPLRPDVFPGREFSYSGEAFFYLQRVLEEITRTPFARFMETELLRPLGMSSSSFAWKPELDARMAVGHDAAGDPREMYAAIGRAASDVVRRTGRPMLDWRVEDALAAVSAVNPQWPALPLYAMPNAACSFLTTSRDYAAWLRLVLDPDPQADLRLTPATRAAMRRPTVTLNSALSWGLGWGVQRDDYGTVLWQWGANMSFRSFVLADPEAGRAVAVLTNGENGARIYERVVTAITGHDHPAFLWM